MTKRKAWSLFAAKGVVSFVLIAYLIQRVGISNSSAAFQMPSLVSIMASCVLLTAYYAMNSVRWVVILQALGIRLAMRKVLQITLVTQFFSQLLPSSLGADMLRMWMSAKAGLPTTVSINSVLLERITYLAGLSILVGVIFPYCFGARFPQWYSQSFVALAALAVILAGLLAIMDKMPAIWLHRKVTKSVCRLSADSRCLYRSPGSIFYGFVALLAGQVAFSATLMVLGPEFGIDIAPVNYLAIGPVVVLLSAIPVSIAGWGVRELSLVALLSSFGADASRVLQLSLAIGLLCIVASLPGALMWIINTHATNRHNNT